MTPSSKPPFDLARFEPPLTVPTLDGGPVHLRPFNLSDSPLVCQAAVDPYIPSIASVPRAPCSEAEGGAFIARQHERAAAGHGYSFVITDTTAATAAAAAAAAAATAANGAAVGVGSIGLWFREIESGRADVGYWLLEAARGRHLAGHALRTIAAWAFDELAVPRLHLFVEPWNVASARTAAFAGFKFEAHLRAWERVDGEQRDADCYARLASNGPGPLG